MWRLIGGIVVGVVAWFAIVTAINFGLRYGWPEYAAVEKAMNFTLAMMIARLAESAVASLISGAIAAAVARGDRSFGGAGLLAGLALMGLFAPVHYWLWSKFPVWYHLTFLLSLPILSWVGGQLVRTKPPAA
jgi:hypothetical protein